MHNQLKTNHLWQLLCKNLHKAYRYKILFLVISLCFSGITVLPAQTPVQHLTTDSITFKPDGLLFKQSNWRFHAGDSLSWNDPAYADTNWKTAATNFGDQHPLSGWNGIGWFRLWFTTDASLQTTILALRINHDGASEIYLDGQKIAGFGKVGHSKQQMVAARAPYQIIPFSINNSKPHLLAVRYSNFNAYFPGFIGFQVWVNTYSNAAQAVLTHAQRNDYMLISVGAQVALVLLHFFLFLFYRRQKLNLYYSLFILCSAATLYIRYIYIGTTHPATQVLTSAIFDNVIIIATVTAGLFLYAVSYPVLPRRRVLMMSLAAAGLLIYQNLILTNCNCGSPNPLLNPLNIYFLIVTVDGLRALALAIKNGKPGVWLIGLGIFIIILFFF